MRSRKSAIVLFVVLLGLAMFQSLHPSLAFAASCPAGWTCADIGNPGQPGSSALNGSIWTINGGGKDIWGTADQFQYAWQTLAADGTLSARVLSQTNTSTYAKAGVMFRLSTDPGAPYYLVAVSPSNGILIQYRKAQGANAQDVTKAPGTVPAFLRIARTGTTFSALTSPDGVTWTTIAGSSITIPALTGSLLQGLAVTAHNNGALSTATFDSVAFGTPVAPPPTCSTGWTCADIGKPGLAGSATLNTATKVWTISGGGNDIWGTTDQFQYVWQTLAADGTLSAHVTSQTNTSTYAKAGVMFRLSTDPAAPYYLAAITPANGLDIQYRKAPGTNAQDAVEIPGTVPVFVRIIRTGTTFATATSSDGVTWTPVAGSSVTIPALTGSLLQGLAVTAHNNGALSTATFDSVAFGTPVAPPPTCATGWTCADIGNPGVAGSATLNGSVWTVSGSGNDIWGLTDQFQYAWQPLTTDGTLSAHVTSQTNTSGYAKAGVMFRASTDPGAPYYLAAISPANGILIQYRATTGTNAQSAIAIPGTVPVFLQIIRTGATFTTATSPDGVTWTPVAGSSVAIPALGGGILAGLAVTAHNNGALSTATFDSVALTTGTTAPPTTSDWVQYLHDLAGSDYNSTETTLTASTIPNLKVKWTTTGTGGVSDQPIESKNVVYWGSWDGNLHATTVTGPSAGKDLWATNLGVTTDSSCVPSQAGVASTPTLGQIGQTPVLFVGGGGNDVVGGGNVYVYAINATNGQIIWKTVVGSAPSDFAWSSPVLYNGSLFYGVASFGDCPLTRGRLVKLDQATGTVQGTFYTEPAGCTAGGIWGTPTIDAATGMLYAPTGTPSYCTGPGDYGAGVLEINTANLSYVASWQVPVAQRVPDSDFGSAPTLFTATINGVTKQMVGIANKNGYFYAFDRTNAGAGPLWEQTVASGGNCPQCGGGSISPAAWDGTTLYVAGGGVTINGTSCSSSVNALNPATGAFLWQRCLQGGPVLGSVTAIPGVVVVTEGKWIYALSMSTGATLFSYQDTTKGAFYYGPATIANGYLFAAGIDGVFLAFSL